MAKRKKEVREHWLHIRLNKRERDTVRENCQKTTCRELSDYARRVLLQKPVTVNHRDASADDVLAELVRIKNAINAVGNNLNQAVHKLHTLDTSPQIRLWLLQNEGLKRDLQKAGEEALDALLKIGAAWSPK